MPSWRVRPFSSGEIIVYQRGIFSCAGHVHALPHGAFEWFTMPASGGTFEAGEASTKAEAKRNAMRSCGRLIREAAAFVPPPRPSKRRRK